MKFNVYYSFKIILLCILFTDMIICSKTETHTEGKFLLRARFLKKKKTTTNISKNISINAPKKTVSNLETLNLLQKSEKVSTHSSVAIQSQNLNTQSPAPIDLNIGTGPIWVTGWIKYFKYFPSMKTKNLVPNNTPRQFSINPQYNEQYKLNPNFNKEEKTKDELGHSINAHINDINYFYAKLLKNQILILSSFNVKFFFNYYLVWYYSCL